MICLWVKLTEVMQWGQLLFLMAHGLVGDVPTLSCSPIVSNFAWQLATDSLRAWNNKHKHGLEVTTVCLLCGTRVEDNYHPFYQCPLARYLWCSMSLVWQLPALNNAHHTGKEWLLHFLDPLSELERSMVIMIFWRCWHIRSGIIHDKVPPHL